MYLHANIYSYISRYITVVLRDNGYHKMRYIYAKNEKLNTHHFSPSSIANILLHS